MLRYSILVVLFSLLLHAKTLKDVVQEDSLLSEGYTGFITYEEKVYLIAVGVSKIEDSSPQSKINAIKVAKIVAQSELTKFIHQVKLTNKQELKEVTITTKEGEKAKHQYTEKFIETIREESDGILRNVFDVGKWKKGNEYFFALGIEKI